MRQTLGAIRMKANERGRALILDICLIRGGITKLGRSSKVLVGFAGVGLVFAANPMKGAKNGSHIQPLQEKVWENFLSFGVVQSIKIL